MSVELEAPATFLLTKNASTHQTDGRVFYRPCLNGLEKNNLPLPGSEYPIIQSVAYSLYHLRGLVHSIA